MSAGPGKYDAETTAARQATSAKAVVLIILGGDRGSGFSVQMTSDAMGTVPPLPDLLRSVADQIEDDIIRAQREAG